MAGYAAARRGIGAANKTGEEANFSPAVRLKNAPNYPSVLVSTGAEIGNSSNTQNNPEAEGFAENRVDDLIPGFPVPWEDSAVMPENITGLKRFRDGDVKPLSGINAAEIKVVEYAIGSW